MRKTQDDEDLHPTKNALQKKNVFIEVRFVSIKMNYFK